MRHVIKTAAAAATLAMIAVATPAAGSVTFDPDTATGFVGKGDVQVPFAWNNKQLQTNANEVVFTYNATTTESTTWTCSKPNPSDPAKPDIVNQRSNTTTTSIQGVASSVSRENSKGKDGPVTGFILQGYVGTPTVGEPDVTGNQLGSCPANPSGFTHDGNEVAADPVTVGGLYANYGSLTPALIWPPAPAS